MLFVFVCILWCPTYFVLCFCFGFFVLCTLSIMLTVSLDCLPFLISPSVYSNVYYLFIIFKN
jgi:hypothetical protein